MRLFIQASLAALAIATTLSFASPATARPYTQGGVIPCSADDFRFVQGRGWVSNCRRGGHGMRGHQGGQMGGRQLVPRPFTYLKSRTCRDWRQPGGVGPKITTRVYAC